MSSGAVKCSSCGAELREEVFNIESLTACPNCHVPIRVEVFPAQFQAVGQAAPATMAMEGESSCFYHAQKKAVIACQMCGRFLCALCDLDLNGRHICPSCLESGQKKSKLTDLQNTRVCYDDMLLLTALLPLIACLYPSMLGAPLTLYLAVRHWNSSCGLLGKSRWKYIVAIVLASVQVIGWIVFFIFVATKS